MPAFWRMRFWLRRHNGLLAKAREGDQAAHRHVGIPGNAAEGHAVARGPRQQPRGGLGMPPVGRSIEPASPMLRVAGAGAPCDQMVSKAEGALAPLSGEEGTL